MSAHWLAREARIGRAGPATERMIACYHLQVFEQIPRWPDRDEPQLVGENYPEARGRKWLADRVAWESQSLIFLVDVESESGLLCLRIVLSSILVRKGGNLGGSCVVLDGRLAPGAPSLVSRNTCGQSAPLRAVLCTDRLLLSSFQP